MLQRLYLKQTLKLFSYRHFKKESFKFCRPTGTKQLRRRDVGWLWIRHVQTTHASEPFHSSLNLGRLHPMSKTEVSVTILKDCELLKNIVLLFFSCQNTQFCFERSLNLSTKETFLASDFFCVRNFISEQRLYLTEEYNSVQFSTENLKILLTRKRSSRMSTACFSDLGGGSPWTETLLDIDPWTETPWTETPWTDTPWAKTPLDRDPSKRNMGPGSQTGSDIIQRPPHLWTEWQTHVKTLPCPKLRLRAVIRIRSWQHNMIFLCFIPITPETASNFVIIFFLTMRVVTL